MTKRLLLTTRRTVPLDQLDDYFRAWQHVRATTEAAGGRAWLYRGAHRQDHFIEFIEWTDESAPALPERDEVASARTEVDQMFGAANIDEWEEA